MSWKRIWAMFKARNCEFFRDRAAFGWNFLFPFLIIAGFGIVFSGKAQQIYKVGVYPAGTQVSFEQSNLPEKFRSTKQLEFIGFHDFQQAQEQLGHHRIDLLVRQDTPKPQYWVVGSSPRGAIAERLLESSFVADPSLFAVKQSLEGTEIRYIDWLFPGVLGMNMMFSSLWGVGYVIVRYRKNGALKRLRATPLTAFEFLTAQAASRIFLLLFTLVVVWVGADLLFSFHVAGSYLHLFLVFTLGGLALTAMGLALAARGTSEEFASGVLNFIAWPMMFLSEVWFSIEGAPQWVKRFAELLPLTHVLRAARRIMNDGADLAAVAPECAILAGITLLFLALGASLFSWND